MAPILVVIGLLLLGVAIVAWHTRHTWWHLMPRREQASAAMKASSPPTAAPATVFPAEPDAFAQPPVSRSAFMTAPVARPVAANESDPFAHAPDAAELNGLQSGDNRS
jgi:hypothetical protein